ncbi:MAG: hypothetical protein D6705_07085 [Deltaproteobacteria bacterium]|nr:MAG: hypothetical protein D6705_07085 [Deltaproteobacteria bacterium]
MFGSRCRRTWLYARISNGGDLAIPRGGTIGDARMERSVSWHRGMLGYHRRRPPGDYVVLAGFENDLLVRDPDPSIAGTQIVHISVDAGATVDLAESFKITGALTMVGPGADGPEAVDPSNVVFSWADDSSEDYYTLAVYDAFGNEVWSVPDVPRVTGSATVDVAYAGPALEPGMYYQWRAESWRDSGPISTTEDLLGVFYVPATGER